MTGIGLHAPMPLWWTLAEGPWIFAIGLLLIWLVRQVERAPEVRGSQST